MRRFPMTSAGVFAAALLLAASVCAQNVPADDAKPASPSSTVNPPSAGSVEPIGEPYVPMTAAPTSDLSASPPDPTNTGEVSAPATFPTDVMATGAAVFAPDASGALATAADTSSADSDPLTGNGGSRGRWGVAALVLLGLLVLVGLMGLRRRNAEDRDVGRVA